MSPSKIIASVVAGIASVSAILWGVPYYIDAQVDARLQAYFETNPPDDPANHPKIVEMGADMRNVKETTNRIEGKVDAFGREFRLYLERQQ